MSAKRTDFGDLLEPGLRKVFDDTYKLIPEQYSKLFNVLKSSKQSESDSAVTGFGLMDVHTESAPLMYEDVVQGNKVTYTHKTFRKGFSVSREMYEDDQYNVMNKKSAGLAKSAARTVEYYAASIFNNAFNTSYVGGDGKPLCSVIHPNENGDGTQSNASSTGAVLAEASLEAGILAMRGQLDGKGMKIQVNPTTLVISPALENTARILLESMQRSGTANNDINPNKGKVNIVVYDWLTSNTAWFLLDKSMAELNFFWRVKPEFKQDTSFDTDEAKFKARARFSWGFSDWRGVYGSKGDGAAYAA